MTNFKPSELPADSVIDDEVEGVWMKEESGVWGELTAHCGDCARSVTDAGRDEWNHEQLAVKADEFFLNFKIISLPMTVVNHLVDAIHSYEMVEWHESDRDQILKDAIEEVNAVSENERLANNWKELHSFEYILIEVNELGQFRCNNQIFNPVFDCEGDYWVANVVDANGEVHPLNPEWFVKQNFNKEWKP